MCISSSYARGVFRVYTRECKGKRFNHYKLFFKTYMHIILTGVHMEMTEAIRSYALEKMRGLEKFVPHDDTSTKLSVELSKTSNHHNHGDFFEAEAQLHIRGKVITLKATEDDLYKAIDILKDMLARELIQHKDKGRSVFRRSAQHVKNLFKRLG